MVISLLCSPLFLPPLFARGIRGGAVARASVQSGSRRALADRRAGPIFGKPGADGRPILHPECLLTTPAAGNQAPAISLLRKANTMITLGCVDEFDQAEACGEADD